MRRRPPRPQRTVTLFPPTALVLSPRSRGQATAVHRLRAAPAGVPPLRGQGGPRAAARAAHRADGGGQRGRRTARGNQSEAHGRHDHRSEEHTSELQSLMRISYAVFCLKKTNKTKTAYN